MIRLTSIPSNAASDASITSLTLLFRPSSWLALKRLSKPPSNQSIAPKVPMHTRYLPQLWGYQRRKTTLMQQRLEPQLKQPQDVGAKAIEISIRRLGRDCCASTTSLSSCVLRSSPLHQALWDEAIGIRLGIDNDTRWSSWYYMINRAN
jgi:hypothetical protein